ncbi:MAG: ribonuclease III [Gammaproteobacteria bacterium]
MIRDREELVAALGYSFRNPALLDEALTHRSARGANNERLEFLGDAVLGAVVAAQLFRADAAASEGDLSRLRASLVKKDALADIAVELELGEFLSLGGGELKSGGFRRRSILADALEAIIGAVYCDGGTAAAEALIERLFTARLQVAVQSGAHKDAKTRLQETLQKIGLNLPEYEVADVAGADHERVFRVTCNVPQRGLSVDAKGRSRRRAEQRAAAAMLEQLDHA